ncbi:hypothetical protein PYCCODRAFT_451433 [Trametes coccinea BRFM310]|uniref:Uncharacterized protein n=1 Tax=Trametes coccinea (strain BRFM310) TaxID=1353009 RepID=A0A1Y2IMF1_TRAC3|nr:hypothetical protein PYCCODRAFT_451433 [Trametes coccinea BRFM310]
MPRGRAHIRGDPKPGTAGKKISLWNLNKETRAVRGGPRLHPKPSTPVRIHLRIYHDGIIQSPLPTSPSLAPNGETHQPSRPPTSQPADAAETRHRPRENLTTEGRRTRAGRTSPAWDDVTLAASEEPRSRRARAGRGGRGKAGWALREEGTRESRCGRA